MSPEEVTFFLHEAATSLPFLLAHIKSCLLPVPSGTYVCDAPGMVHAVLSTASRCARRQLCGAGNSPALGAAGWVTGGRHLSLSETNQGCWELPFATLGSSAQTEPLPCWQPPTSRRSARAIPSEPQELRPERSRGLSDRQMCFNG